MGRLLGAVCITLTLSGCPITEAAGPTPGGTCSAVRASGTAEDGTALVCDEQGRWVRRYLP